MTNYKQYSFDAYCKALLRHAAANAHKARKRRAAKTVPFSGLSEREMNRLYYYDSYDFEKSSFTAYGRVVEITNENLSAALERLTPSQRDILLLYGCFGLTDAEIGNLMGLPRSTVQYRRKAAASYIRNCMEGTK